MRASFQPILGLLGNVHNFLSTLVTRWNIFLEDSEHKDTIMAQNKDDSRFVDASTDGTVSITPFDISKIAVRVPPFWPEEPEIWFANLEGQFCIAGITADSTKFYYVISQLDQQYSKEVKDIITSPPATGKYEKIKSELIRRLCASQEKKVQQLLMHEELGDRKPSQFLRHLQGLAGVKVPEDFLKTIWTSRLPENIQTVLAGQPQAPLEVLADLADRVHDIVPSKPGQVASTSCAPASTMESMAREIAALRKQLAELTTRQSRKHTRGRSRSRSNTRSQSNYRKFPICWYHHKHGSKASKCIKPCDYKSSGNSQGSR